MPEPRYTEAHMREIFARAARSTPVPSPEAEGFTLDELQRIGASAGLDPAQVAAAAASLDAPPVSEATTFGMRREIVQRRVVPRVLTDEAWEAMVMQLREAFGGPGRTGQTGRTRDWASPGPYDGQGNRVQALLTARPLDGGLTELTLSQPNAATAPQLALSLGTVFSVLPAALVLVIGLFEGKGASMLPVAALLALLGVGLGLFVRQIALVSQRRTLTAFEAALDRLERLALRTAPDASAPAATLRPSLDDTLPESDPATGERSRERA